MADEKVHECQAQHDFSGEARVYFEPDDGLWKAETVADDWMYVLCCPYCGEKLDTPRPNQ